MPGADVCPAYTEELTLLEHVVRQAGAISLVAYHRKDSKIWDKSENHPVTDADIAVNDYLQAELLNARPGYGWLSEETQDDASRHSCQRSFVVDPIDGTRAFIDRKPGFAVCVAIIEGGQAIAGVVFNPLKDEFYAASLGGGATLNGQPVRVSAREQIENSIMVGYPLKFKRLDFPDMQFRISNSMAYRMTMVAAGKADATLSFTPKSDWDIAAAALIATEAGAIVTNLYGDIPRFDRPSTSSLGVVCASPCLHALLLARMKPVMEKLSSGEATPKDHS